MLVPQRPAIVIDTIISQCFKMDRATSEGLLRIIHKYYPIGVPHFAKWQEGIRSVIENKIRGGSDQRKRWDSLILQLRDKGMVVQDLSFLQFPNLMCFVENLETISNIQIKKNFVICASLLCPYYTCYFEYKVGVQVKGGVLPFGSMVFFSSAGYDSLKISASITEISNLFGSQFPEYTMIGHYDLMMFKVQGGVPYGEDSSHNGNLEHSIYQYLFYNEQPNSILP